jgi:Skp family chaperone for outer membrane proteins
MSTITDTDLQQLKDLITAGQLATQKQIAELDKKMEVGFAKLEGKIDNVEAKLEGKIDGVEAKLEGKIDGVEANLEGKINTVNAEIKGIQTELTDIKSNQKAQDLRFWSLVFLILTSSIGFIGRLAKFY